MLSKTGRTAENPHPSSYGALTHRHLELCKLSVEMDQAASTFSPTPTTAEGRASLGGCYEYLILINTFCSRPLLTLSLRNKNRGNRL
jgi:hypothetical protein